MPESDRTGAQASAGRSREFAMLFPSTPEGASLARRVMVLRLRQWGLDPDTPALLIAELAGNAVTHCTGGHRDFFLRMTAAGRTLRVECADNCRGRLPEVVKPDDDAESGRGMLLVDALSEAWGVEEGPGSKKVWCEVALPDPHGSETER